MSRGRACPRPAGEPSLQPLHKPGPAAAASPGPERQGGPRRPWPPQPGAPAPGREGPRPLSGPGSGESGWPPKKPWTRHRLPAAPDTSGAAGDSARPRATAQRRHDAPLLASFRPEPFRCRRRGPSSLPVFRFSLSGRCEGKDGVAQGGLRGCWQRLRRLERQRQGRRHGRLGRQASADRRAGERRDLGCLWRRGGRGGRGRVESLAGLARSVGRCRGTVSVPGPGSPRRPDRQERFRPAELPKPYPGSPCAHSWGAEPLAALWKRRPEQGRN